MKVRNQQGTRTLATAEEIRDQVNQLVLRSQNYEGSDRRSEDRHGLAIAVQMTPVDAANKSCGKSFVAVTRDISISGFSVFVPEQRTETRFSMEFLVEAGDSFKVFANVLRSRRIGPLWEMAGTLTPNES